VNPEEIFHRRRLDGSAALARDQEERPLRIEFAPDSRDRGLVGGVHDHQARESLPHAVHGAHDLRAQTAAAHAQQIEGCKAVTAQLLGRSCDPVELRLHHRRHIQPTQAIRYGLAGRSKGVRSPDGDVPAPNASYKVLIQQFLGGATGRFVDHAASV